MLSGHFLVEEERSMARVNLEGEELVLLVSHEFTIRSIFMSTKKVK